MHLFAATLFVSTYACLLAGPATTPASRPAGPRPDERKISDALLAFSYCVPKTWKQVPQDAKACIYIFQLPMSGTGLRATPSWIVTAERVPEGTDLAKACDNVRARIKARNADVTLKTDKAATIAGHGGWAFAYDTRLKVTVTTNPGNVRHDEMVPVTVRDEVVVDGGRVFEFVLTSDEKGIAIRSRLVDRALETLTIEALP